MVDVDEFEYDVYGDLDEFNLRNSLNEKNDVIKKLEEQYHKANNDIGALEKECKFLKKKCRNIEKSFWSLLETSKAEIKRKDAELDTLKKQRDDIAFRRINTKKQFVAKYPSERRVCFSDSDKTNCNNFVGEKNKHATSRQRDHTDNFYNPFKHSEELLFRERNKQSPARNSDRNLSQNKKYKSPTMENAEPNRHLRSPKRDLYTDDKNKDQTRKHSQESSDINSNDLRKLLLRKRSRSSSFNKGEQSVKIKEENRKEENGSKISNKRTYNQLDKIDDNFNENGNTKKKRGNLCGENNHQTKNNKIESRLDENRNTAKEIKINNESIKESDKINSRDTNSSKARKTDQSPSHVLENNCKEPVKMNEEKRTNLEPLKKIDEKLSTDKSYDNKSKTLSKTKTTKTFEEILFDDMVSGRDALKLKSPSTENTPLKNYPDNSCIYDNLEDETHEPIASAKINLIKELNIAEEVLDLKKSSSKVLSHPQVHGNNSASEQGESNENISSENLNATLEEGLLVIEESDESYKSAKEQQRSINLQEINKKLQSKLVDIKVQKNVPLSQSDIVNSHNSNKLNKNHLNSNNVNTKIKTADRDGLHDNAKSRSLKNTDSKKNDSEPSRKTTTKKCDKDLVDKTLAGLDKCTESDLCQKENRALISNSLKKYRIPKLKKSNDIQSENRSTATASTIAIESNTANISNSVTQTAVLDSNVVADEEQASLKLNVTDSQSPDIISLTPSSTTNEIKNQKIQDEDHCYKTITQSPLSSESFKSVQTTPETSPEQAAWRETVEATTFLTENLLTPIKLNVCTNSEHDDQPVVDNNSEENEDKSQEEQKSIDELETNLNVEPYRHKSFGLENNDIVTEDRDENCLVIKTKIIKNKHTVKTKTKLKQKAKGNLLSNLKKKYKTKNNQNVILENIENSNANSQSPNKRQDCKNDTNSTKSPTESVEVNGSKKSNECTRNYNETNLGLSGEIIPETHSTEEINTTSCENKIEGNLKADENDELNLGANSAVSETLSQTNPIRKSVRIAKKKEKSNVKLNSSNEDCLQNEEKKDIEPVSSEGKLSEKDEELFNRFFKSPFNSESTDSINTSAKSELSHQIEKDFEKMFSTPSPISITEPMKRKSVENKISNSDCIDKLDSIENKTGESLNNSIDNKQDDSLNLSNTLNLDSSLKESHEISCNTSSIVSPLIKKFSTSVKEYELITNENENNLNESVTWVITRRRIKKKKNKE